ncbi:hypothetical protein [Actinospongicola halichondriae]|uniref:hypothetical protein n=1 Tax=Actinospongicola halichondriae TaxID=3236844 RepID=UPI003D43CB4F
MSVDLTVDRHGDHLLVRWATPRSSGSARFDHLPGTVPEWLGSADDLLDGATRRDEGQVLDALAAWASGAELTLGLWSDDAGVDVLG